MNEKIITISVNKYHFNIETYTAVFDISDEKLILDENDPFLQKIALELEVTVEDILEAFKKFYSIIDCPKEFK